MHSQGDVSDVLIRGQSAKISENTCVWSLRAPRAKHFNDGGGLEGAEITLICVMTLVSVCYLIK